MLTAVLALVAALIFQEQAASKISRDTREPSSSISYAQKQQAEYRSCLIHWATDLSTSAGKDSDEYLANVADLSCPQQRDAFLAAMERELRQGAPRLEEQDIARMTQDARNQIVAWAEGFIFGKRLPYRPR